MRYKLLALDLDGTALGSDPERFSAGLAEAAADAAAAGCAVVVATGRPAGCLPADLTPPPAWVGWLALCDGAELRDARTGVCLWRRAFPAAALERVQQAAAGLGLPAEYIDRESVYHLTPADRRTLDGGPVSAFHRNILAAHGRPLEGPASGLAGREILKINMPLVPQGVRQVFRQAVGAAALVLDCGPGGLEVTAPGAGKKAAVAFLAERLGFGLEKVMALGDSGNDADLLAAAGLGVAMGNAPAAVRTAAGAVTGKNTEGGAAAAIRRWLLAE